MSTAGKKQTEFFLGLGVTNVSFSIKSKETYEDLLNFFKEICVTKGELGRGLLSFKGLWDADKTIFIGLNENLKTYTLRFDNAGCSDSLDNFRENYLNLDSKNEEVKSIAVSSVEALYGLETPSNVKSLSDFREVSEQVVKVQQKVVPKVLIDKGSLYIGGTTGSNRIQLRPVTNAALDIQGLQVNLKIKDSSSEQFMSLLLNSIETDTKTLVAYMMVSQFGKVTLTEFIEKIRKLILKDFNVGQVIPVARTESRATTSRGKYVIRSLNGIRNNLLKSDTSEETKKLLIDWLKVLYSDRDKIKNGSMFFNEIAETLKKLQNPSSNDAVKVSQTPPRIRGGRFSASTPAQPPSGDG